jgi:periplasmic protein TonB
MKQFFLSILVVGIIFLIYLKFETDFFENVSLTSINNNESYADADTVEVESAEAITDSVYQGDKDAVQNAVVAGESDVATEEVIDASRSDAEYPGGMLALSKYIVEHLKYPEDERKKGIHGTCKVQFVVNIDGSISIPTIITPIKNGTKCNKEALRVIKAMPHWVPATINGKDMPSVVSLPIKFELD